MSSPYCNCDLCQLDRNLVEANAEIKRLRAQMAELKELEVQSLDLAARETSAVRDRLKAVLLATPENVQAVARIVADIEGVEPWDDVAEALLASLRARAGIDGP